MAEGVDYQARADLQTQVRHCDDCQNACRERRNTDQAASVALEARVRSLENQMTAITTRLGMWAAGGAILGSLVVGIFLKAIG